MEKIKKGLKLEKELFDNIMNVLSKMDESVGIKLDGLELNVGDFVFQLKGNVSLRVYKKG